MCELFFFCQTFLPGNTYLVPYFSTVLTLMIATQERLEDSGTLLYPSITFCPKYIWQVTPPGISHSCCSLRTCRSSPGSWSSSTTTSPWTSTTSSSLPSPTFGLGRRCCLLRHVEPCNDLSLYAQVFSFVSHQNAVPNQSFPCNTVGGSKKGKPCAFPFIYQVGYIS